MRTPLTVGILAHVDAGKTTLTEAMLYLSGARRTLGRVDHGDAFLDTHAIERARGITIFSKLARFSIGERPITLLDTPGHADFSAEAERTMPVLDCAVLVISAVDGVQAHTLTLWHLLERYHVPVILFVNKLDLPTAGKDALLSQFQSRLSPACADFTAPFAAIAESAALCDEALLETYLHSGTVTDANIRELVAARRLFPCCFGSALKLTGVQTLLETISRFAPESVYPPEFRARIYKISRDAQGNRLTWLKCTGGSLSVRDQISYVNLHGESVTEKAVQLRLYSGERFTAAESVQAGQIAAVTGLSATFAGQTLGGGASDKPLLEPVMRYRVCLPPQCDAVTVLPKLRQLEEEDPQLRIGYNDVSKQIHVQIMGKVQLEVLREVIRERFSLDVQFDSGRVCYKETILNTVEGVGHFEPLRHYAEVHLLLEPLPRGSGLQFDTVCPTDVLDAPYQKLVLTHLAEKTHRGVLIGAPITDMKITLLIGKAHLKHTEGGDFRQATYRAVRQGLMQAQSVLLEPWYAFTLTLPTPNCGRAITDVRAMGGKFDAPVVNGELSILTGLLPASQVRDYPQTVAAYTQGRGQLQLTPHGYDVCHDAESVIAHSAYDPCADLDNTPDSVFCAHGAGFSVKWDAVKDYMHLESPLKADKPELRVRNLRIDDKELEAIMEREFGAIKRPLFRAPENRPATEVVTLRPPREQYLIVDGYNIIFAWDELAQTAQSDLDAARRRLIDLLSSYAGYRKCHVTLVFDGYKVKGSVGEKTAVHNIHVVYTRENETADAYIEALLARIGASDTVRVATSDALVQLSSLRSGVLRVSARELREQIELAQTEMKKQFGK